MLFEFQKDLIKNYYPFIFDLKDKEYAVINFFSLDMVKNLGFNDALCSLNPDMQREIFEYLYLEKINENTIYPYRKNNNYNVINIPFKFNYEEDINYEMIKNGLIKLNSIKDKYLIEKIIFSKDSINIDIIKKIISEIDDFLIYEFR